MNGDQWLDEQETWEHGVKAGFKQGFQAGYTTGYEKGKLSQKAVLDKIEDEINSSNRGTYDYFIVDRIEEIINKYKAESEV